MPRGKTSPGDTAFTQLLWTSSSVHDHRTQYHHGGFSISFILKGIGVGTTGHSKERRRKNIIEVNVCISPPVKTGIYTYK